MQQAVSNHDISTFEKHVDVDGILIRMLTDLPGVMNESPRSGNVGFIPEETMSLITSLMEKQFKDAIQQTLRESTKSFIERGHFDKQLTEKGSISKLLKVIPIDSLEVLSLGEIQKEGKICYVPLNISVKKYDGRATAKFMLRDKGGYWQVAEVSNLPEFINQLKKLQATYPYRNLFAASKFIAQSIDNEKIKIETLTEIANEVAQAGDVEKASLLFSETITLANTIKDKRQQKSIFKGIAKRLVQANNTDKAISLAESSIEDPYDKDDIFCAIVIELAKNGETDKAISLAESNPYFHIQPDILSFIAKELIKKGDIEKAKTLFTEAVTTAKAIAMESTEMDAFVFIAQDFAESGNIEEAINIVESMFNETYRDGVYFGIAKGLAQAGDIEQAKILLESTIFKNKDYKDAARLEVGLQLIKTGKTEEAISIAKTVDNEEIQAEFYCMLGTELAKSGEVEQAKTLLEESMKVFESMRGSDKSFACCMLGTGFVAAGDIEKAKTLFTEAVMNAKSVQSEMKNSIFGFIATNLNKFSVKNKDDDVEIANAVMTAYKGSAI